MDIAINAAKARLTDLVRRAQDGEAIVLSRDSKAAVRRRRDAP